MCEKEQCQEYAPQILTMLNLKTDISPAETAVQSGGVNYGWYRVAAAIIGKILRIYRNNFVYPKVANILAHFAFFAGVGRKTSMGMGQTKFIH